MEVLLYQACENGLTLGQALQVRCSVVQSFLSNCLCLFVCFVALRPKSTAMVIAGRSVHLTTLFPGQACTSG